MIHIVPSEDRPDVEEKVDHFNMGVEGNNLWAWLLIGNILLAFTILWPRDLWEATCFEFFVGFEEPRVAFLVVQVFGFGFELKGDFS